MLYKKRVFNLNSKKAGTFGNILTKLLRDSSVICNLTLQDIWNCKMLRKQHFPKNLTTVDITPVYKKKIQLLSKITGLSAYFLVFLKSLKE